jgi:hydroxymethylbilane synthase
MLVIASRGSQLALWQARWVEAQLAGAGRQCRIEIIKTTGDRITDVPLAKVGSKGLFTKEIEEALLDGRADLAVHSLKDLPTELPQGLVLAAIPAREDPRDAIVGRPLADLPAGARVGTSSLRRAESVRGNVDTRLRKLDEGRYDSIVLAAAGLKRLGWAGRIAEILDPHVMCSAVGQGALAIETRAEGAGREACAALDHPSTRAAVTAERGVLATLGGGCQVPIGAHATVDGGRLRLFAIVVAPDGSDIVVAETEGASGEAASLGRALGEQLLAKGAGRMMAAQVVDLPAAP